VGVDGGGVDCDAQGVWRYEAMFSWGFGIPSTTKSVLLLGKFFLLLPFFEWAIYWLLGKQFQTNELLINHNSLI
jgi:hypothetical protein